MARERAEAVIEIGDRVQLVGYTTLGRVVDEAYYNGVRFLRVAWEVGGGHIAPEDGWVKVVIKPRSIWYLPIVVLSSTAGTVALFVLLAWLAVQS